MLQFGLDPGYVLDRMEIFEIKALLEYGWMRHKDMWECSRLEAFVTANAMGAKLKKLEDLLGFPWEGNNTDQRHEETPEEREEHIRRLEATAKYYENLMRNGKD